MEVNEEKILDLARQIYMGVTPEEVKKLSYDVGQEVTDTKIINEIDTNDIKPDVSVLDRSNSLREDKVLEHGDLESLLSNANEVEDNMFVLPKIVQN